METTIRSEKLSKITEDEWCNFLQDRIPPHYVSAVKAFINNRIFSLTPLKRMRFGTIEDILQGIIVFNVILAITVYRNK